MSPSLKRHQAAERRAVFARKKVRPKPPVAIWPKEAPLCEKGRDTFDFCGPALSSFATPLGIESSQIVFCSRRAIQGRWLQQLWQHAMHFGYTPLSGSHTHTALVAFSQFCSSRSMRERETLICALKLQIFTGVALNFWSEDFGLLRATESASMRRAYAGIAGFEPYRPVIVPPLCPTPRQVFHPKNMLNWSCDDEFELFEPPRAGAHHPPAAATKQRTIKTNSVPFTTCD